MCFEKTIIPVKPDSNDFERNWLTAELFSSPAQLSSQAQSEMMVVEFPNIIILISQALRGLARAAVLCCEAGYSPRFRPYVLNLV